MFLWRYFTAIVFSFTLSFVGYSADKEKQASIIDGPNYMIFIGNSYSFYNNGIHRHVKSMVTALDKESTYKFKLAAISAASLQQQPIDYLVKSKNFNYDAPFDYVILQGNSSEGLTDKSRASFLQAVAKASEEVKAEGSKLALYMTPAYATSHSKWQPDMLEKTKSLYEEAGKQNDALVIPVGLAFQRAYEKNPNIQLHMPDNSHPTILGSYLTAAIIFASIYKVSPVNNSYDAAGKIDAEDVLFLQEIADEVVSEYFNH